LGLPADAAALRSTKAQKAESEIVMNYNAWFFGVIVSGLLGPQPAAPAGDPGGVAVRLEDYQGPATIAVQLLERFKLRITVDARTEVRPLRIRVELPDSGPWAWPVADVEVRDGRGRAVSVRRSGIEWGKLLIPVPAVGGAYLVQAVSPAGGGPSLLPDKDRRLADNVTNLRLRVTKWYDGGRAALSLRFDDSHPTHLTKAIPILREYGFRGTFMVNPGVDEPGSRRRSDFQAHLGEWERVARAGDQEFANHSAHHRGARGDADMEAEIGTAAQAIWNLTPRSSRLLALNLGGGTQWETTRTLRYYLDKYHQFNTGGSLGMDDVYGRRVAAFREHVEAHLERGLWCRVHFHSIGEGLSSSEANFRAALDVAKEHQSDLWIAGMADIYKYRTQRNASKLTLLQSDFHHLTFQFTCLTDPTLYDQPLTLEVASAPSLEVGRLAVRDAQGKAISLRTATAQGARVLRFDVPPQNAVYSIEIPR
jgi:hypothetical protein